MALMDSILIAKSIGLSRIHGAIAGVRKALCAFAVMMMSWLWAPVESELKLSCLLAALLSNQPLQNMKRKNKIQKKPRRMISETRIRGIISLTITVIVSD